MFRPPLLPFNSPLTSSFPTPILKVQAVAAAEYLAKGGISMTTQNPDYQGFDSISDAQRAHDLAVAYSVYVATSSSESLDVRDFYQDYENAYPVFLNLVKFHR